MAVQKIADFLTGGKGIVGQYSRQKLLWKGRAEAARMGSRIDALEKNQETLQPQTQSNTIIQQLSAAEKAQITNPLKIDNISVVQVFSGDSKKDQQYAKNVTYRNTKLLEQFVKSTKGIEKNTKKIKEQDTSLRKQKFKDRAKASLAKIKSGGKYALKTAKKTGGILATILQNIKDNIGLYSLAGLATVFGMSVVLVKKAMKKVLTTFGSGVQKGLNWLRKPEMLREESNKWEILAKYSLTRPRGIIFRLNRRIRMLETIVYGGGGGGKRRGASTRGSRSVRHSLRSTRGLAQGARATEASIARKIALRSGAAKAVGAARGLAMGAARFVPGIGTAIAVGTAGKMFYDMLLREQMVKAIGSDRVENLETEFNAAIKDGTKNLITNVFGKKATAKIIMAAGAAGDWTTDVLAAAGEKLVGGLGWLGNQLIGRMTTVINSKDQQEIDAEIKQTKFERAEMYKQLKSLTSLVFNKLTRAPEDKKPAIRRRMLIEYNNYVRDSKGKTPAWLTFESHIYRLSKRDTNNSYGIISFVSDVEKVDEANKLFRFRLKMFKIQLAIAQEENKGKKNTSWTTTMSNIPKSKGAEKGPSERKTSVVKQIDKELNAAVLQQNSMGKNGYFALGMKVNGVIPPAWPDMQVDLGYLKWIDSIEAGGDYYRKGDSSSAYGRYQFMPKTAREVAQKEGIPFDEWKEPINQDKMFQRFTNDNAKYIASRSVKINIMSLWVAHNLGIGNVEYMMGASNVSHSTLVKFVNKQMPKGTRKAKTPPEAKSMYLKYYLNRMAQVMKKTVTKNRSGTRTSGSSRSMKSAQFSTMFGGGSSSPTSSGSSGSISSVMQMFDMGYQGINGLSGIRGWADQFVGRSYSQTARGTEGAMVMGNSNSYDCSSLAGLVAQELFGIPFNVFGNYTETQYDYLLKNATKVPNPQSSQPGDFVMYKHNGKDGKNAMRRVTHIGIVVGKNEMLHARSTDKGIQITDIFKKGMVGIFRINADAKGRGTAQQNKNSTRDWATQTATVVPQLTGVMSSQSMQSYFTKDIASLHTKVGNLEKNQSKKQSPPGVTPDVTKLADTTVIK